ncbi:LysR family transcriptional regulator [Amycolatopsis sp. La24]|uniref:LysR family transcriptional regulator n=1 Tax=Amycolatopsis sp. La24 TaxID=3028304 RepID=UPI0023B03DCF|nr:LysR family transcriptional regulator [Amycolatopsis sp. La24]
MNLEDLRYFLALTRYGKLTVAAARLSVEHTTIRRRITALEKHLGQRLFDKTPRGWTPTPAGRRLLPHAERIEAEADAAAAAVADRAHSPQGTVRIVATDGFGSSVIAPGLARLRTRHPGIEAELVTSSHLLDYGVGEFDLAVTIHRPERPGFHVEHLCDYHLRLYGSPDYLASHPEIHEQDDLTEHDLVWFVASLLDLPELQSAEDIAAQANVVFRTTNLFAQLEATAAGIGLGLVPCFLAHHDPRLRPVLHDHVHALRSFWVIIPDRLLNTERVTTVAAHLAETARLAAGRLIPPAPDTRVRRSR